MRLISYCLVAILLIAAGQVLADAANEPSPQDSAGTLDEWAEAVLERSDQEVSDAAPELQQLIDQALNGANRAGQSQDAAALVDSIVGRLASGEGEAEADAFIDHFAKTHTSPDPNISDSSSFMERARAVIGQPVQPGQKPMFVLTTFGIGENAMRSHFEEASAMDRPVVFVIRGFDPDAGGLQGLVNQMLKVNKFEVDVEIHVNPVFFQQYQAERGPVFLLEGEDGITRVRRGQVNLTFAEQSLQEGELDLIVGETTPIEEPDLLAIMKERAENFTGGEQIVEAAAERAKKTVLGGRVSLPPAREDESYLVDPAITLNRDITLPDGTLVARAGTVVNPLEFAPWSMQVIVFDATSDWQVEQALDWDAAHDERSIFITTRYPENIEDQERLAEKLPGNLNLLDELVVSRMALRSVPSLVRQEGNNVRVLTRKSPETPQDS
jgi:conjugal transfer pilus assembly protein TraW